MPTVEEKSDMPSYDDVVFSAFMGAAQRTYGSAIGQALADEGCDDMPRRGSFVLGAISRHGAPLSRTTLGALIEAARDHDR